jgi:hypothetical protein
MVTLRKLSILAIAALLVTGISGISAVFGDTSTPVNYISANFAPISALTSFNYDWSTGAITAGTATVSILSTANVFTAHVSAPAPKDPNGYGTFIGTAHPERFNGQTVVYTQSACPTGYPTCFSDGTFTYGYMVLYNVRGSTLDHLTTLATNYNVQAGCFGGGSPRFSIIMSDNSEIFVYLGTSPNFTDCPPPAWQATGNLATDSAGLRWDTSQVCTGTFYNNYSGAIACANLHGLTISAIFLSTDGGWSGTNPATTQTILFHGIQVNSVTRFPN